MLTYENKVKKYSNLMKLSLKVATVFIYIFLFSFQKLEEQITKNSPSLGRDAVYLKSSKISRLPAYLSIQFVRFSYKEREAINAKILKDVKFPLELDVYELCRPELQEKLLPMRDKFKEIEDKMVETSLKSKEKGDAKKEDLIDQPFSFPDGSSIFLLFSSTSIFF